MHTHSLNPLFSALDEDVYYATREKVALELLIKISTQFPVSRGVIWVETAEVWQETTLQGKIVNQEQALRKFRMRKKKTNKQTQNINISFFL